MEAKKYKTVPNKGKTFNETTLSNSNDNSNQEASQALPLWGGHFANGANTLLSRLCSSIQYDKKLFRIVIDSLSTEVKMKKKRKIIAEQSAQRVVSALEQISKEIADNTLSLEGSSSIYEAIFNRVKQIAPQDFDSLRIAHSHSSQISGDLKTFIRDAYDTIDTCMQNLQVALIDKAEENVKAIFPGIYNNQLSQPTSFGHHLMGYVEIFARDRQRIKEGRKRLNESPYACGEIAGNIFNINREIVAKNLNFERSSVNSVEANNSRDYALEFVSVISIAFNSISRLVNELILWHSSNANYISFSNDFVEQSQVVPYKRAPKALESLRAKCSQIYGNLMSLLSMLNNLPLSFANDLTAITDISIDAAENSEIVLQCMAAIIADMKINRKIMKEAASHSYATSADFVDYLALNAGLSLTAAESKVREIVEYAINKSKKLSLLELEELQSFVPNLTSDVYSVLIPSRTLIARRSGGGSNPVQIRKAIRAAKRKI